MRHVYRGRGKPSIQGEAVNHVYREMRHLYRQINHVYRGSNPTRIQGEPQHIKTGAAGVSYQLVTNPPHNLLS